MGRRCLQRRRCAEPVDGDGGGDDGSDEEKSADDQGDGGADGGDTFWLHPGIPEATAGA